MLAVYFSVTGQTRRFVKKLDWPSLEITPDNAFTQVNEPFVLIAPTYEREVTDVAFDFLSTGNNRDYCVGLAGGGNLNFNTLYCFTVKDLSEEFQLPILLMFEFQGSPKDVSKLKEEVAKLETTRTGNQA